MGNGLLTEKNSKIGFTLILIVLLILDIYEIFYNSYIDKAIFRYGLLFGLFIGIGFGSFIWRKLFVLEQSTGIPSKFQKPKKRLLLLIVALVGAVFGVILNRYFKSITLPDNFSILINAILLSSIGSGIGVFVIRYVMTEIVNKPNKVNSADAKSSAAD